jgi:hypothetical protein
MGTTTTTREIYRTIWQWLYVTPEARTAIERHNLTSFRIRVIAAYIRDTIVHPANPAMEWKLRCIAGLHLMAPRPGNSVRS